eukprot:1103477-Pelagomonas_calceolata.AAC.9
MSKMHVHYLNDQSQGRALVQEPELGRCTRRAGVHKYATTLQVRKQKQPGSRQSSCMSDTIANGTACSIKGFGFIA